MDTSQEPNRFTLTIRMGNEAMREPSDIANALQRVESEVRAGYGQGIVRDKNGNTVGRWRVTTDEEENR